MFELHGQNLLILLMIPIFTSFSISHSMCLVCFVDSEWRKSWFPFVESYFDQHQTEREVFEPFPTFTYRWCFTKTINAWARTKRNTSMKPVVEWKQTIDCNQKLTHGPWTQSLTPTTTTAPQKPNIRMVKRSDLTQTSDRPAMMTCSVWVSAVWKVKGSWIKI